ncbi:Glycosyltransferase [Butyrivibrio fibrisolvens 16/4]|nr:Glycosyltransferase [Butyrivibrio fibrisolvens 16/4]
MKIAIISHGAAGGGSERVCTILANYLAEYGNEVHFLAMHSPKREYYIRDDVHYKYCDIGTTPKVFRLYKRIRMMREYLQSNKIDVMICFIYAEGLATLKLDNLKKIYSLRNDPNKQPKFTMRIIKRLYSKADAVVFQTNDAKDYFDESIRKHGIVIPNPLKDNLPVWDAENSRKTIIAAGRLSEQKNFEMLINAFADFVEEFPDYILSICGEGELENQLKDQVNSLGIEKSVKFEGHVTDLHDRMVESQIYVSSSNYEGISNSMLEALAIGVPTVCTDCPIGGAKMFIKDGENGFLVKVGDAKDLTEKMKKVATDLELRNKFSNNAQKIRKELEASIICHKWKNLLEEV